MIRLLLNLAAVIAVALTAASCTANRVQNETLLPAAQAAWPEVRFDIEQAPPAVAVDAATLDSVGEILDRGIRVEIRQIDWLPLEVAAQAGIDQQILVGEISEGVGISRREMLDRFRDALLELQDLD